MNTDKFVNYAIIEVNQHKTCYWDVKQELENYGLKDTILITPINELMEKDYMVRVAVSVDGNDKTEICVVGGSVASVMKHLDEVRPELYKQIPEFNIETFENIAAQCKASSSLSLQRFSDTEEGNAELESTIGFLGENIELDDFTVEYESVEDYYKEVREKRITTDIHCYPHTPVGSWSYHGLDFQSLLDYVTKNEKEEEKVDLFPMKEALEEIEQTLWVDKVYPKVVGSGHEQLFLLLHGVDPNQLIQPQPFGIDGYIFNLDFHYHQSPLNKITVTKDGVYVGEIKYEKGSLFLSSIDDRTYTVKLENYKITNNDEVILVITWFVKPEWVEKDEK